MKKPQLTYPELVKELRHRYEKKYGKVLDDEIIYLIVRINELEVNLKKEIAQVQKPIIKNSKEIFMYGFGKAAPYALLAMVLIFAVYSLIQK